MAADAKPIAGDWEGTLDPGAQGKKRIVVHISAAQDGTLSGTIDYPDQETSGSLLKTGRTQTVQGFSEDFPDVVSQQGEHKHTANAANPEQKVGCQLWRIDLLFVHRRVLPYLKILESWVRSCAQILTS
jgi:hypothetical protein